MGVKLQSSSGGSVEIAAPVTASNYTLTAPTTSSTIDTLARTGNVLQVVGKNSYFNAATTSAGFVATGINCNITPTSATSKIIVCFGVSQANTGSAGTEGRVAVYRNGSITDVEAGTLYNASTQNIWSIQSMQIDSPATTSAITYELYFRKNSGSGPFYLQQNNYIVLMEIAG